MLTGAAVLLRRDGKVLLTLRKAGANVGTWELPAGHIKPEETPDQTVVRETYEETGLHIASPVKKIELTDESGGVTHVYYEADIVGGTLENREPDQHEAVQWWSEDALPENLGPAARRMLARNK